ncbi:PAS domain-containing protein [Pedomonas sp.]|uniref:PAS domain-containing protein n=1 Tax=Pedomonas sp. TaxID=2976421 RepID=UPI002F3E2EA5
MLAAKQPMFIAWGAERTLLYNDGYMEILASKHPSAMGRDFLKVWSEIQDDLIPIVAQAYGGHPVHMSDITLFMERKGYREETHFSFSYTPVRDERGIVAGFFCPCVEITDHVFAERRRIAEAARLQRLLESTPGFSAFLSSPDLRFEFTNRAFSRLVGGRDCIGRTVTEALPEIAAQGFPAELYNVYETGVRYKAYRTPVRIQASPDAPAEERILDFVYEPVLDDIGGVTGVFVQGYDVTEQVRAEANVQEHQARLAVILEQVPLGVGMFGPTGCFTLHNAVLADLIGDKIPSRQHKAMEKWQAFDARGNLLDVEDYPGVRSLRGEDASQPVNFRHVQGGEERWIRASAAPLRDSAGQVTGGVLVAQDVTDEVNNQRALRQSEERLRKMLEIGTVGIIFFRIDGCIVEANDAFFAMTGYTRDQVAAGALRYDDLTYTGWEWRDHQTFSELSATGQSGPFEMEFSLRDGSRKWVLCASQKLDDATAIEFIIDISARKEAETKLHELNDTLEYRVSQRTAELAQAQEALRQSQKLEAMGQLTGGVAHDFNNLLMPIIGGLDLLQRRGIFDERAPRIIEGALASAERAKTLVQRLLAFARRQPLQPTAVNIGKLIEGMVDLISSTTGPQVRVTTQVEEGLPLAWAEANQIEMALLNLSVNARDAMPEGGVLTISATEETVGGTHQAGLRVGRYICLSVTDTGIGMDEATLKRAIEPFFSTKGIGKGTGLGLSMVHGLVAQLGGGMTIASQPERGTKVQIWLPVAANSVEVVAAEEAAEATMTVGTALLVDDDELGRTSTTDMLDDLGYTVVETASAEAALQLLAEGLRPDIVITDHLMPGMPGTKFARKVRRQFPAMPVLIISGYAEVEEIGSDLPRLTKPFRRADLAAAIADMKTAARPEPLLSGQPSE